MSDIKGKETEPEIEVESAEATAVDDEKKEETTAAKEDEKSQEADGKDEAADEAPKDKADAAADAATTGDGDSAAATGTAAGAATATGDDIDMEDVNPEENDIDIDFELEEPTQEDFAAQQQPGPVPVTRKDKTLSEFLGNMDEYAPIIPDAVTDYYLAKSGFQTNDVRIKRLLALATQKFISDLASDAYQHSRIRSSSSVSSASNPQARAKALVAGVGGSQVQSNSSGRSKIVLTMEDLSSASSEYGLNLKRPDFYR